MEGASNIRVISESFIKSKHDGNISKKPYYFGPFELQGMFLSYLQNGLLFDRFPSEEDGNMQAFLKRLTQSLSSALDHYYPLAGQFVTQVDENKHESIIFVDCNKGPGAKFIHAAIDDVTVQDIISTYVPSIIKSFFHLGQMPTNYDGHDEPLLVIQVTELVDGIFLGVSANHVVVDGTTFWSFLSSWSEIFQSNDHTRISRPPICERWFPEGCGPIIKIPHVILDKFITRSDSKSNNVLLKVVVFDLSYESIAKLKAKANEDCALITSTNNNISSFQALSALLWRSIVRARGFKGDENSICVIIANARPRLVPPLSQNYFGNFIFSAKCDIKVSSLLENNLGWVALSLHKAVEELTDQCLRDEFLKMVKSPFFIEPVSTVSLFSNSVVIGGTPREDEYGIEFGLGKAVTIRNGLCKYDGRVVLHPGKQGKGSVSVQICLSPEAMITLQQDQEFTSFLY